MRDDDDESELSQLLPGVKRLRSDRINVYQQRQPTAAAIKSTPRRADSQASFYETSLSAEDSHFNSGLQVKLQRKIRQGAIRPEASIDLHGYRQAEALLELDEFMSRAIQRRYRMILIIHGQGFRSQNEAILKPLVQRWLSEQEQVLGWCPAQLRDGAAGASYVYLRAT
ncbi:Smr/MutS family protein [Gammaproteobacteria bacterium]|nr:Smr/MutS family protein [Gammaproteobacteria bacterium]